MPGICTHGKLTGCKKKLQGQLNVNKEQRDVFFKGPDRV